MYLIEPCCASKHFMLLRDTIGTHGKATFEGYGDLSLTEMLPAILTRYSKTTMMIVAPSIPEQAANVIYEWLRKAWARMDGKGRLNVISNLTIVTDLREEASPTLSSWLENNPFPDRLSLVNKAQDETALLLPDMAVVGPLNMRYGEHFICEVTTKQEEVSRYWEGYSALAKPAKVSKAKTRKSAKAKGDTTNDNPNEEAYELH